MAENTPPMLAIREANTHLQALHERNQFLENENVKLTSIVALKKIQEERFLGQVQVIKDKDEKINHLEKTVQKLSHKVQENTKKDLIISQLTKKVKILNEILNYKAALESITTCLEKVEQEFIVDIDNLVNIGGIDDNDYNSVQLGDNNNNNNSFLESRPFNGFDDPETTL